MKKILLISLLFLTGCSVQYDLVITDKEEVKEKFYVYVDNEIIENNSMSIDEYLDHYSSIYSQNERYKNFNITTKEGKNKSYFKVNRTYKNLNDYTDSYSFKSMFDYAEIERGNKYTSFTTSSNAYLKALKNDELISESSKYDSFKISIKFYNEVVNHNADEVDKKNNIYTWNVEEDDDEDFIFFKIGPKVKYNVVLKDKISENILSIGIISGLVVLIASVIGYVYVKSKKNNEI